MAHCLSSSILLRECVYGLRRQAFGGKALLNLLGIFGAFGRCNSLLQSRGGCWRVSLRRGLFPVSQFAHLVVRIVRGHLSLPLGGL